MEIDWTQIVNWLRDIGVFLGIVSFILIVVRFCRERPILKYNIWRCYYNVHKDKDKYWSIIIIDMIVDNIGDRSTTIKGIGLKNIVPKQYLKKAQPRFEQKNIPQHSSQRIRYYIDFPEIELKEEKINIELVIVHTHTRWFKKKLKKTCISNEMLNSLMRKGIPKY